MAGDTRPITFLSDYGYDDEFAGACRAVIARCAPGVSIIDLTHGVLPGDVRRGALALEAAAPRLPGAVHLAVVDPGVGTDRRAVAVTTGDGSCLVGPDNGLLAPAAAALGGPVAATDISQSGLRLEPVSATFHGRDLFAPVAAHLAAGRPLDAAGDSIDPAGLVRLDLPSPRPEAGGLAVHVLYVDRFGNLVLDARPSDLAPTGFAARGVRISVKASAGVFDAVRGATFADGAGGLVLYDDSSGRLGLAVDRGDAGGQLGARRDDEILLCAE